MATLPAQQAAELFKDSVGQENGLMNPRGNITSNFMKICSDRTHVLTSVSGESGDYWFEDLALNYNLKSNQKVRL